MVFSNFAQVLYSVLAEGRSFAQFTRNIYCILKIVYFQEVSYVFF